MKTKAVKICDTFTELIHFHRGSFDHGSHTLHLSGGSLFDDTTAHGDEGSVTIVQTDEFGKKHTVVLSDDQLSLIKMFLLHTRSNDNDNIQHRPVQHLRPVPTQMLGHG